MPSTGSNTPIQTYVPVTAGTAQAKRMAVVSRPRPQGPSERSSRATSVPRTTVSATVTTANTTVLGTTVRHSSGSANSSR